MKPINIEPTYTHVGLTNVINRDGVAFIDIHGNENYLWDDDAAMMKKLIELLGEEE